MKKRARLKDISEALNLSITTISRALNDKEDISAKTKEKVLEVAKLLNYQPNYFAKYLHKGNNNLIGVIVPRIDHAFYSSMIDGIMNKSEEYDYLILIGESHDDPDHEIALMTQFEKLDVAGHLIAPSYLSRLVEDHMDSSINWENIVLIDRSNEKQALYQITNDHIHGAYIGVKHLIEQGYQRIAHIKGLDHDEISELVCEGYLQAIQEASQKPMIYQCEVVTPEEAYKGTQILMKSDPPDAIFAISDEAALGVYRYCYEHNIRISDDLGVVGYSNAHFGQYLTPSLTTIDQRSHAMGEYAVELLSKSKSGVDIPNNKEVFQSQLIVRESSQKVQYEQ